MRRERVEAILIARENAEVRYRAASEALWLAIYVQELSHAGVDSPTAGEMAQAARMGLSTALWGPSPRQSQVAV